MEWDCHDGHCGTHILRVAFGHFRCRLEKTSVRAEPRANNSGGVVFIVPVLPNCDCLLCDPLHQSAFNERWRRSRNNGLHLVTSRSASQFVRLDLFGYVFGSCGAGHSAIGSPVMVREPRKRNGATRKALESYVAIRSFAAA